MNNRDNILKERLKYQENWVNYYQWYIAHSDISEKVSEELKREQPLLSLIINFYYLPINILKYFRKIRAIYDFNKCVKEIDVLKKELELKRLEK